MFDKLDEIKVLRDPIHGYVKIEYKVIWDCLGTKEFQRLRRIKQLGASFMVYHTAEHSRFSHSLGVYELSRQLVFDNQSINDYLGEYDKVCVMLAALLHDLGHGPYSHAFEAIMNTSHEEFTKMIILGDSEINQVLNSYGENLVKDVESIIAKKHKNKVLCQIVSGQLDADRMDYLLRDAYFTGTAYGEFDIARILRTLLVKDNTLCVKYSGIHSVEDYIMARYHMYWQVYYHPVARSYEMMMHSLFKCYFNYLSKGNESIFKPFDDFLQGDISLNAHYQMDEATCNYGFKLLAQSSDKVISDLATRLIDRDLFKYSDIKKEQDLIAKRKEITEKGFDDKYYVLHDQANQRPYQPYHGADENFIYILSQDDNLKELSVLSPIVRALLNVEDQNDIKMYYPKS